MPHWNAIKKMIPILYFIGFTLIGFSQHKGIKISNEKRNEQLFIKHKHRIRLKTKKGVRLSGKYKIIDKEHIIIKGISIPIKDVRKIKKNPLGASIITSSACFIGATALVTGNYISNLFRIRKKRNKTIANVVPAAMLVYIGIKSPNLSKAYRKANWKIEIVN